MFRKQIKSASIPEDMTLKDVLQFVEDVYNFTIPEGKEPGEHVFNVLDYYRMEEIGAFVSSLIVKA